MTKRSNASTHLTDDDVAGARVMPSSPGSLPYTRVACLKVLGLGPGDDFPEKIAGAYHTSLRRLHPDTGGAGAKGEVAVPSRLGVFCQDPRSRRERGAVRADAHHGRVLRVSANGGVGTRESVLRYNLQFIQRHQRLYNLVPRDSTTSPTFSKKYCRSKKQ